MNCREHSKLVLDVLDHPLSPQDQARADEHLADCSFCQGVYRQFTIMQREIKRFFLGMLPRKKAIPSMCKIAKPNQLNG